MGMTEKKYSLSGRNGICCSTVEKSLFCTSQVVEKCVYDVGTFMYSEVKFWILGHVPKLLRFFTEFFKKDGG